MAVILFLRTFNPVFLYKSSKFFNFPCLHLFHLLSVRESRYKPTMQDLFDVTDQPEVYGVVNVQSPVTSHQSPVTSHQSPVTSHQSPVTSHQSPVTSHQSPVTSHQSPVTSHQSPVTSHQSPVTSHQSPVTSHQSPVTRHIMASADYDYRLPTVSCRLWTTHRGLPAVDFRLIL